MFVCCCFFFIRSLFQKQIKMVEEMYCKKYENVHEMTKVYVLKPDFSFSALFLTLQFFFLCIFHFVIAIFLFASTLFFSLLLSIRLQSLQCFFLCTLFLLLLFFYHFHLLFHPYFLSWFVTLHHFVHLIMQRHWNSAHLPLLKSFHLLCLLHEVFFLLIIIIRFFFSAFIFLFSFCVWVWLSRMAIISFLTFINSFLVFTKMTKKKKSVLQLTYVSVVVIVQSALQFCRHEKCQR